ncbi:hypothetical protein QTP88_015878 [Uroleucon formosanum]
MSVIARVGQCSQTVLPSDSTDLDASIEEAGGQCEVNYRHLFIYSIFGPAIMKLASKSVSRMKGAGNPTSKKWHIHQTDWMRLTLEAYRILNEMELNGKHFGFWRRQNYCRMYSSQVSIQITK